MLNPEWIQEDKIPALKWRLVSWIFCVLSPWRRGHVWNIFVSPKLLCCEHTGDWDNDIFGINVDNNGGNFFYPLGLPVWAFISPFITCRIWTAGHPHFLLSSNTVLWRQGIHISRSCFLQIPLEDGPYPPRLHTTPIPQGLNTKAGNHRNACSSTSLRLFIRSVSISHSFVTVAFQLLVDSSSVR